MKEMEDVKDSHTLGGSGEGDTRIPKEREVYRRRETPTLNHTRFVSGRVE